MKQKDIDVVLICETLPKVQLASLPSVPVIIKGYDTYEDNTGRGVIILFKENLELQVINNITDLYSPALYVKVLNSSKPLHLAIVYRSPNITKEEDAKLNKQLKLASKKLKNLTIFGDFNHPEINWQHMNCSKGEDHAATTFLHIIQELKLDQLTSEPTHFRPNCKPSLIDLVLTNNKDIVNAPILLPPLGKSHHAAILNNISHQFEDSGPQIKVKKFQVSKGNYDAINEELGSVDWDSEIKEDNIDVNTAWTKIANKIKELRDKHVPSIFVSSVKKKKPTVLNNSLLHLIREKRWYFKRYRKYRTETNHQKYCLARAQVNKYLRHQKRNKELKIAKQMKQNTKAFYQYIASKTTKKDSIPDLLKEDGTKTKDDAEKSELLNCFFSSVFTNENLNNMPTMEDRIPENSSIHTADVSIEEMKALLKNLNPDKSPGTDEIHPRLLKECAASLAKPLKILFDKTMSTCQLPDEWKTAEIRPIYKKKGSKQDPSNYRPISLTSVVCKVFEKVVKDQLCSHLINNNLLSSHQFGFVPGRNTKTQLLVTVKEWIKNLDNDIPTDVAFMDFRKAFDAVPHQRLLYKLQKYGVKGHIHSWITNFLSDRTQYVKINNSSSQEKPVTSGVPQGSVLGPMLFIFYINDLPDICSVPTKIYADDTKAYTCIRTNNDHASLQESIDQMYNWTQSWQLHFNASKCKILHIGEKNPQHAYFIGNGNSRMQIETTTLEKDLGVLVDTELNFESHIEHIVNRASSKKATILRNFSYRSKNVLVPLFKALVRPILEYANTVWDPSFRNQINYIESVQRSYTQHILEVKKLPYEERLKKLRLPSLEYRRFRGDLIELYKIAQQKYDRSSVNSLFQFNQSSRLRGHNFKVTKVSCKKRQFQHYFTNRTVNHWNKLSKKTVNSNSLDIFKNNIDRDFRDMIHKTNLFNH